MSISLTAHTIEHLTPDRANEAAELGAAFAKAKQCRDPRMAAAWEAAADVQIANGMTGLTRQMLTEQSANHKLKLGVRSVFGLTLFHHVMRSTAIVDGRRLVVNACPFAGDCTRLCVINNNRGRYEQVRLGWRWRTDFMVRYPYEFVMVLSFSIGRAIRKGPILFRPNVNSDVEWELVAPALFDGTIFGDQVTYYGYTKVPYKVGDGWLTPVYRVAFSVNESHLIDDPMVIDYLTAGGNVAVVTDRRYDSHTREPIRQWHDTFPVVDGDVNDEWIIDHNGVIGDLAFKPDNNEIREWGLTSPFVHSVYTKEAV